MLECVIWDEAGSVAYIQVSCFSLRQREDARERVSMAKSADADAAVPVEVEMNQRVGALSAIDDPLVPTEGTASLELADATGCCHCTDGGGRAPAKGQGWVQCLVAGRVPNKVNIELAHLGRHHET